MKKFISTSNIFVRLVVYVNGQNEKTFSFGVIIEDFLWWIQWLRVLRHQEGKMIKGQHETLEMCPKIVNFASNESTPLMTIHNLIQTEVAHYSKYNKYLMT